jgi:S1-C subfamily serine protease
VRRLATTLVAAAALFTAGCGSGDNDPGGDRAAGEGDEAQQTRTVERTKVEVIESPGDEARAQGFDAEAVYRRDGPGVVSIVSVFEGGGEGGGLFGGGDDEDEDEGPRGGVGSGFIVNEKGEIATNAHVVTQGEGRDIEKADEVFVKFADDNQVPATIVGFDPNADIALLRLKDTDGLTVRPLRLGRSDDVRVGAPVVAIGSPFGEEQSVSVGVVSATDRAIDSLTGFQTLGAVQTDAAINPGNSGGPLINAGGEVIGVNAQIRTRSGGGEGVGYAIPVDQVRRSLEQIRDRGEVRYAYLGVSTTAVYPQLAERFDLGTEEGAWVQDVVAGGPGADAGIRAGRGETRFQAREYRTGGDVIVRVEETPIRTENDLGQSLAPYAPGQEVDVEVIRGGERQTLRVKLGERPAQVAPGG